MNLQKISDDEVKKRFGHAVKKLRQSRTNLSQEEFGFEIGCHRTYISQIERGIRNPGLVMIIRIATVLNLSPSDLIGAMEVKFESDVT